MHGVISQGNGMLQDPNHTGGLLCVLDPFLFDKSPASLTTVPNDTVPLG